MYTVYGRTGCIWCERAVELLEQRNLPYQYRTTDDLETLNELKTRLPNVRTIPQIWWDQQHIGGFEHLADYIENTSGGYGEGKL